VILQRNRYNSPKNWYFFANVMTTSPNVSIKVLNETVRRAAL